MNEPPTDIFANLDRFRLTKVLEEPTGRTGFDSKEELSKSNLRPRKISGEFLKGPIPLSWLTSVAKLSGKAPLSVALAVWFEAGRRKKNVVRLTTSILERFNVNRKTKYSALKSLEKAGLISVHRTLRRNPVVTILDVQTETGPPNSDLRIETD